MSVLEDIASHIEVYCIGEVFLSLVRKGAIAGSVSYAGSQAELGHVS